MLIRVARAACWVALASCGLPTPPALPAVVAQGPEDAAIGVSDARLAALIRDHWDDTLTRSPVFASQSGDRRFHERLADPSVEAAEAGRVARDAFLRRAVSIDRAGLSAVDQGHLDAFVSMLEREAAVDACRFETWAFSPTANPIVRYNRLPHAHVLERPDDLPALLARYRAIPGAIDAEIAAYRQGLSEGRVVTRTTARAVETQAEDQLAAPTVGWSLLDLEGPALRAADPAVTEAFRREARGIVEREIAPAYARWRDFVRDEVLPAARSDDHPGVGSLPDGARCYRGAIAQHVTAPLDPAALHQAGLDHLVAIHDRMRTVGARAFGTDDLAEILLRLRTDPSLRYPDAAAITVAAEASLARAQAESPRWFGRLPRTPCVVHEIPATEAPYATIAYYMPPHPDGSRPGAYYVNTSSAATRPAYEAAVLAFHESVPGHHLQIALAQEEPLQPAFRRDVGANVFVEGWGLYAETLAEEAGLYTTDLDTLGRLSFAAWRASRLVVDTGLHDQGWSRAQAEAFLRDNTALADENVRNEVDRYIGWPGQALSYKVGEQAILALRAEAQRDLGAQFTLPAFHDALLRGGPVPLPMMEARVRAWIQRTRAGEPEDPGRVRVASFNVHGGEGDLAMTAAAIRASGAEIVGVQETRDEDRSLEDPANPSIAADLAAQLGWFVLEQPVPNDATWPEAAVWSNAVISRFPIEGPLPSGLGAVVRVGDRRVNVFNVHFNDDPYQPYQIVGLPYGDQALVASGREAIAAARSARGDALARLIDAVAVADAADLVVITGDFNEPSHRDWTRGVVRAGRIPYPVRFPTVLALERRGFVDAVRFATPDPVEDPAYTWTTRVSPVDPSDHPDRIDFLLVRGPGAWVESAGVLGEEALAHGGGAPAWPSDHRAVTAVIRY